MFSKKALKNLTNKELVSAYEAACYTVCHKMTAGNCKALDQLEEELLRRLEEVKKA